MRLFVPLTKTEFDALRDLARAERRRPQDQAAVLLAQTLADAPPRHTGDPDPSIMTTQDSKTVEAEHATA
jgi:hypothetical protein